MEQLAAALQASLLPPSLPTIPTSTLAARYRPASRYEVGGDFYDVFPIDDQSWGFVIGDVMGKGPHAASRTSCARYSLRAAAIHEPRPSAVLETVNQALLAEADGGADAPFVTALFARVETRPEGGAAITFASAGHPLPTVLRADGTARRSASRAPCSACSRRSTSSTAVVELAPGDSLVLITDGVHDSGDPPLHVEGLEALLEGCRGLSAAQIVARVDSAIGAAQGDDVAIMVLCA